MIGIIGNGFVGNAVYQNFRDKVSTKVYDVDKNRSLNTLDEVINQNFVFVCLPTPMTGDGSCDTSILDEFFDTLPNLENKETIFVIKSTVPVRTTSRLALKHRVIHNPEFLTARNAVNDFANADRNIIGGERQLAEKFADSAREMGHEADVIDLVELDMPMFSVARSKELDVVPGMAELKEAMSSADSLMVIAPEYNGSMPPTLNNAVAWLSTELQDFRALFNRRKVGLATHSGGGGAHVIIAMRQMFSFLGCIVLGRNCVSNKNKEANPETIEDMITQLAN